MGAINRYDLVYDPYMGGGVGVSQGGKYCLHDDYLEVLKRAEAAEAKLAELEKQPPVGEAVNIGGAIMVEWERCISDGTQLFTRPAPAINLTELVPPETSCIGWVRDEIKEHDKKWLEMLRNIKEAG